MRVSELNEAEVKKAVFTFGRLNPPHYGHHAMINTLIKEAQKNNCDWYLFVSSKTGDEKNPLTYEQKVWWIQALFPETKGHLVVDPSIKTPLVAATWLYKKGYRAATFVAGEDDMASYGEMIKSGNAHGQKNPDAVSAGRGFVFNPLDFAISPRLASATNARKNVTDGDPEAFVRSILGPKISPELAKLVHDQLYPTLRKIMGLGETVGESAELNKHTPNVAQLAKKYATDSSTVHRELAKGVKVEFEHTSDIDTATEIAMDHLGERLDYYEQLAKAERAPKKKFDIGENFADGKGPGKPGDSQRHGIPKKATIAQLEKASHAKGRKGQLARWQLNMRRGKKKASESLDETLKKVNGKWALVSRHDPEKVLQYYHGSGHPSKEWVNKVERRVHSFESAEAKIDDNWFKTGSFETYKKATPVKYQTAKSAGTLNTLEGPVKYDAGFKIITGPKGEQYPIPPEKFASLYDDNDDGTATPKKIIKIAKVADHDGVVNTSWGEPLNYTAGNDIIVRHGPNDYGVVKNDIFDKTYVKEDYRDAARYAAQAHAGQQRSGGKPYISHPVRVANIVRKYKDSAKLDQLMSAAFLHDTIEDTDTDEEQLRKMFGDLVASLVKELTSDKEKIEKLGKAEYLTQKMIHMSSWGLVIKLADRLDNVADIKTAKTPEWRHRYRAETESILSKLEQNRKLSGTHQNLIAAIRAKLAEIDESYIREDEETVKPRVYLDMDGVLADFFGEWSRISGVDHYKDINDVEAKLQLVRDHPTFWVDLPLLPHAKALIKTVVEQYGEYRICSKPLEGDARSKLGKMEWIKTHLSDMPPAEIILTADKAKFATHNDAPNILVDDYGVNINSWRAAGGIGIKYEDSAFLQVAKILTSIAKSGVSK